MCRLVQVGELEYSLEEERKMFDKTFKELGDRLEVQLLENAKETVRNTLETIHNSPGGDI